MRLFCFQDISIGRQLSTNASSQLIQAQQMRCFMAQIWRTEEKPHFFTSLCLSVAIKFT